MAKGSKKKVVRNDKEQSGCMWGLINIFDFRHGHPSQKMLTDKKRVADKKRGSRRITGAGYPTELNVPEDSCEVSKDTDVGEQCDTLITQKSSVKELIEEEMSDNHENGQISKSEADPKQSVLGQQGHGRMNRWRRNNNSLDLSDVGIASEKRIHKKHISVSSLDLPGMMAELSSQVNVKHVSIKQEEDPSINEEKILEAAKVFVSHFVDGKGIKARNTMQPSVEQINALQVLNSNKDMVLKLLNDPDSQLVKHIEKLEDHRVSVGSDFIDKIKLKNQSFFWRKVKGLDRSSSKKHEHGQDASTIVVFKPGESSSQIPETGKKARSERTSHFFFTNFTRRLKRVVRREQPPLGNPEKVVGGENLGMASPSRDRFFIEKIPKSSNKKVDMAGGSFEANSTPEQRISEIYSEAKKHLAEIVGNGNVDGELSRPVLKSLGMILSYSDNSSSPICSPRKDEELKLVAPDNEITDLQGKTFNVLGSDKDDISASAEEIGDECNPSLLVANEIHTEGNAEFQCLNGTKLENRLLLDALPELDGLSSNRKDLVEETLKESKDNQSTTLKLDVVVVKQPCSPSASSPFSSRTEVIEDSDASTDWSERPSPISVLEPIFKDEYPSPPRIKQFPVAELLQPRKIKFEDQISFTTDSRAWEDETNGVREFVKVVVDDSGLTLDQLLDRFLFSEHLLDPSPSVFEQVDLLEDRIFHDPTLLFDLVDEVISDVCRRDFAGIPSLYTPYKQLKLKKKDVFNEIWGGVYSHLESENRKPKVDQVVAEDFSNFWAWMDLRFDAERLGLEIEKSLFEELVEDAIMSLVCWIDNEEVSVGTPLTNQLS